MEKAIRRKEKSKVRRKLGNMNLPEGREQYRSSGPPAPIRSVMFVDNTGGGELTKRLQEAAIELGRATGYRVMMTESAGSPQ